jgi:CO/xanthine dehydrogenase Mo-binding subunit
VHNDIDVGGSYGVKRGIKHAVLVGYLTRRLGFPVRLIEDRLENMRGGDAHGPERKFDLEIAFDERGVIASLKMRALDNVGAYAGRSPFHWASRSARSSVLTASKACNTAPLLFFRTRPCRRRCARSDSRPPITPSSARSRRWRAIAGSIAWKCGGAI